MDKTQKAAKAGHQEEVLLPAQFIIQIHEEQKENRKTDDIPCYIVRTRDVLRQEPESRIPDNI